MVHIVNGDAVAEKLKVDGDVIVWREMYDMGPLHYSWSSDEMISRRAAFFEEKLEIPSPIFIQNCHEQEKRLKDISENEEVVLWIEHDRYDQAMLLYLLQKLGNKHVSLFMVTLDRYPGVERFHGLGQLEAGQLSELLLHKKQITQEQLQEAQSGWRAYTSSDNDAIKKWLEEENHHLPFLKRAMEVHLDYFPSLENGLNSVEQLIFQLIEEGVESFGALLKTVTERRLNDGLSDWHMAALMRELTKGQFPLLSIDGVLPNYENKKENPCLSLTAEGKEVLVKTKSRLELVGIDWWVGGVHLYKGCR
ncbi:DUF1835 domain-containing protein [Halobacillus sp. BBL2006]|uniref:DUF1835 domain-containing protein n=1 Tax=Halobacillus sp. BBL2006 TaxID=1543706 RepID=UPI0005444E76|nr:DUF1835 domain-containing protein [Halobacillus sp. BBL2006]KHE68856.1 hypothetical protein LD39_13810 [Halobacillus sp. BBL2006]